MGMYSYFSYDDVKVTDAKGLFDFLIKIKNKDTKGWYNYMYEDFLNNLIDGKQYTFQSWDEMKLISYWYDVQVYFLNEISKYIEGSVMWNYETNDEQAEVIFKDGKTIFNIGRIEFNSMELDTKLSSNSFFNVIGGND